MARTCDIEACNLTVFGNATFRNASFTGIKIKEGANARMGVATLVNGAVTVANTSVTANSRIFLTRGDPGSSVALGLLGVGTITPGTSFAINSYQVGNGTTIDTDDVSQVNWLIIEPAP